MKQAINDGSMLVDRNFGRKSKHFWFCRIKNFWNGTTDRTKDKHRACHDC